MANKYIQIPITDHDDNCSTYYLVEWKLNADVGYNTTNWTAAPPIIINNVLDNSTYDVRITRFCCDGSQSSPLVLSIDTTSDSPTLATPTGFTFTAGVEQIVADCNNVVNADEYVFDIAEDDEFTVNFQQVVSATSDNTFTGLTAGTVYYGRVKARGSGYQDSDYAATLNATPS